MNESLAGDKLYTVLGPIYPMLLIVPTRQIRGRLIPVIEQPDFRKFPKIPRLNREIIITEKIDGTNGVIHVTEDGRVFAGSRKRWLSVGDDNFGFATWVQDHEQELLGLGHGFHYGEWYGKGIQRNYSLDHRRFALFDVRRWYHFHDESPDEAPSCCDIVPILAIADVMSNFAIDAALQRLHDNGSMVAPGFMKPEGIVIYHTAARQLFKITLEGDEKPKSR